MSVPFVISYAGLWLIVILQGLLLIGLTRILQQMRDQSGKTAPTGPTIEGERFAGQLAPPVNGTDVFGAPVNIDDFDGPLRAVLFVTPRCSNCMVSLDELNGLQAKVRGNVIVVCAAGTDECRQLAEDLNLSVRVIADPDDRLSLGFDVATTPTAVVVNRRGRIVQYGQPGRGEFDLEAILAQQHAPASTAGA